MHHFLINNEALEEKAQFIIKDKDIIHQMFKVLRLKQGEIFFAINNSNFKYKCKIKKISQDYIYFDVIEQIACDAPKADIFLFQSLLERKEKLEFIFQKCTELGVSSFQLLASDRSHPKFKPSFDRWVKIIKEATEQSQKCKCPLLKKEIITLQKINELQTGYFTIFTDTIENAPMPINAISHLIKKQKKIAILIGPENGWSDFERDLAKNSDWYMININRATLRSETAAIATVAIINVYLND